MKKITTLVFLMALFCLKSWGQKVTILDPAGAGGFESGTTFAANGWTEVQPANTNIWQVGTAAGVASGSRAAYMGTSTTYAGSTSAAVQHFYRDIAIPAGAGNVQLTFYLKEPTATTAQPLYVFTTTTANTPVSGTVPSTGYTQKFSNTTAYSTYTQMSSIDLSSYAGTTVRLVFTFKSTTATTSANPAIDNVSITYTSPPTITSFSPTSGCPNSGTVVITGTNLNDVRGITIGGTAVSNFTINSAMQVTATVGNGTTGQVAVTNLGGTATSTGTYTVNPLPGVVSAITGSAEVCPGSALTYSIPASTNATSYTWTVPNGWTIASGQGSTSISATAGSAGQNGFITAIANNACGSSGNVSQTLNITPVTATNNTGYTDSSTKTSGNVWVASSTARDSLHVRRAYLKFPLSNIISSATITSAQLSLTNYATDTISGLVNTVNALGSNDPTTTSAATLFSAILNGAVYNSSTWSDQGTINLALNSTATTDIQNQLSSTGYLALGLVRGNGYAVYRFYGYGNSTNSPTLSVTYTSPANLGVTVDTTTAISSQPLTTQTLCQNTAATALSVTATGSSPTYQWYSNTTNSSTGGTIISGATASTYTPVTNTAGTLYYYVVVTGSCGTVASSTAAVIVNRSTAITAQPSATGQTLCQNTTATALSVTATGTGIGYQWYSNTTNSTSGGTAISGATASTYSPATTISGTLYYYVIVTGSCSPTTVTSSVSGAIVVNPATKITANPATSTTYCQNTTATALSITASGTGTLTYQWYSNTTNSTSGGTTISGATSSTYIPSTATVGTLYYYVIVSGTCSTATSTTAAVIINATTTIAGQPSGATYCQNATATALSVSATGSGTLTYQWYSNTTNSTNGGTTVGTNSSSYTPLTTTSGTLYYYVVVTGTCSAATSTTAAIVVNAATTITAQPSPTTQTICQNTTATALSVTATGSGTLTYQWYSNTTNSTSGGTIISGATSATYTPPSATAGTLYYYVTVTGSCSNATSNTATVVVNQKSTNPTSATASSSSICIGSSTILSLNGGGTGTTIKWYSGSCGGTLVGTGNNLSVSPASTTTYYGRYEDGAPCNYTTACASITITVNSLPTVASITGYSYVGTGKSINLSDATTGGVWSVSSTSYATLNNTTANPVTVTGVAVSAPVITYTVTNVGTTCSSSVTDTIHVYNSSAAVYVTKQIGVYSLASTWYIDRKDGNGLIPADTPPGNDDNITVKHDLTLDQNYNGSSLAYFVITTGGTMTIQPNKYFSTAGVVNFGGKHVTVQSNTAGTGAIGAITNTNGKIDSATNVTVERYINLNTNNNNRSGRAWRLITAPVTNTTIGAAWQEGIIYDGTNYHPIGNLSANVSAPSGLGTMITGSKQVTFGTANGHGYDFWSDIANASPSILYYVPDNTSGKWTPFTSISGTDISSQSAYMLFVRGDKSKLSPPNAGATTLRATGILKQGSQSTAIPGNNAYTVVGNPYASPIDFEKLYSTSSNIRHKFQIWNANLGVYGAYQLIDGTNGAGNYAVVPSPIDGTAPANAQYIPSGAGILVQPQTTAGGTVTINESAKAPTQTVFVNPYDERQGTDAMLYINLNLKNSDTTSSLADGILAKFNNGYASNIDGDDALKQANFNENLSISENSTNLIIEARPDVQKKDTLQLKLWNVTKRQYQLQLKGENFTANSNLHAYLEDSYLQTKQEVSLLEKVTTVNFTVNSDTGSYSQTRFRVVFQNDAMLLPLTLTSVKAVAQNSGVNMSWTVSNEQNIKQYVVERSVDGGKTYTTIATTVAKNANSLITNYSSFDPAPYKGDNLYRIRMETKAGSITYSGIVKVTLGESEKDIQISMYPNPVSREGKVNLQLSNLTQGNYLLSVYSQDGQSIYQRKIIISQSNTTQSEIVNLSNALAGGNYQVRITDSKGATVFTDKLLIAR